MTLQIELSDSAALEARDAFFKTPSELSAVDCWRIAIAAALEAMVEEGMATKMDCTDADDRVRSMLVIRLDGGKS